MNCFSRSRSSRSTIRAPIPARNTLTVDATAAKNIDRLHWLMSRVTNYVGVVNYMGARFTGETDAMTPVLAEVGHRGLLYLDDGSSARSQAVALAGNTPVLRADVVLDADLTPAAIDAAASTSCAPSPASAATPSPPAAPLPPPSTASRPSPAPPPTAASPSSP